MNFSFKVEGWMVVPVVLYVAASLIHTTLHLAIWAFG